MSCLEGMQPQLRQVPPTRGPRSMTAVLRPAAAAASVTRAPLPEPITMTSYSFMRLTSRESVFRSHGNVRRGRKANGRLEPAGEGVIGGQEGLGHDADVPEHGDEVGIAL